MKYQACVRKVVVVRTLVCLLALCCVIAVGISIQGRESDRVRGLTKETYALLARVVVPEEESEVVDLDGAIERLNTIVASSKLRGRIRFARWTEPNPPEGFGLRLGGWRPHVRQIPFPYPLPAREPALPGMEPFPGSAEIMLTSMEFSERAPGPGSFTLRARVEYVSNWMDCSVGERGGTIYFIRGAKPLVERSFTLAETTAKHVKTFAGPQGDLSLWINSLGVTLECDGAEARLSATEKLVVRSTKEEIDMLSAMLDQLPDFSLWERTKWWCEERWLATRALLGRP